MHAGDSLNPLSTQPTRTVFVAHQGVDQTEAARPCRARCSAFVYQATLSFLSADIVWDDEPYDGCRSLEQYAQARHDNEQTARILLIEEQEEYIHHANGVSWCLVPERFLAHHLGTMLQPWSATWIQRRKPDMVHGPGCIKHHHNFHPVLPILSCPYTTPSCSLLLPHKMDWFVKKIVEHVTDEIPAPLRSQIPDNIEQVVKKEIIKDLAQKGQAVDDFVKSPLPLAKPKTKSPYKHVPGMTP
ncbi:hypothetical protein BKA70DRAFT_1416017 [Coprinopsis sp. MPI-PUGE-AT-0042]|nr:hypothetical protein BKA70DRAFT_1416017 [Coprinopsis sp. MPI-PUGE-AT-0042]